jgi:Mg2+ and Co2+ transporter CorA
VKTCCSANELRTESLRDLVTSVVETNLTIQGNRLNIITKKVTSWAAIIVVLSATLCAVFWRKGWL